MMESDMGNFSTTKKEIKNYIFARVPLVVVNSSERERVERILREIGQEMKIEISCYTDSRQVYHLNGNVTKDVDNDPLPFIAQQFRNRRGVTFVLGDVRRINEENLYSREILNLLYLAIEQACTLLIVTPDPIWSRISRFGMVTVLEYPDAKERYQQIRKFMERFGSRYRIEWEEDDYIKASALTRGFSEIQIENILSSVLVEHGRLGKEHVYMLVSQKSRMYPSVPCVQEVQVPQNLHVSGLDKLKQWIRKKKKIFYIPEEELEKRQLETPKGILLAGVPGCGKSYSARMVASEWNLPLYRFDIGDIYDKWVGESERKMREALTFIDNVAPCVVWIDEIEKALSVTDSGNDTGKRVLGQFLFWLQESSSRVFLVATANDVQKLPPELFRKGRFSEIFFVDLPNREERKEAIRQYSFRCLGRMIPEDEMKLYVDASDGFSYADIEYVIKEAAEMELLNENRTVPMETLVTLFQQVLPFEKTNPEAVQKIRNWGKNRAVAASKEIMREGGETE